MELLSLGPLVLLTLVGFSTGAALAAGKRFAAPGVLDLIAVALLWIGALSTRAELGKWLAIPLWLLAGAAAGALLHTVRPVPMIRHNPPPAPPAGGRRLERLRRRWIAFAHRMGTFQSRVLIAICYFIVVAPFGLIVRLTRDPLALRTKPGGSSWTERAGGAHDIDSARKQF